MKCIPEVSEDNIQVVHKQFGYSRYGDVWLGRMVVPPNHQRTTKSAHRCFNDQSSGVPETEIANGETGNNEDKKFFCDESNGTVLLKTLNNESLRSEFLHEMKSKWFISAKSEKIAKLVGHMVSPRTGTLSMVIECGDWDLNNFLRNCDTKKIG